MKCPQQVRDNMERAIELIKLRHLDRAIVLLENILKCENWEY